MDFWTVSFISLIVGLILVIGGFLVVHMGQLVKAAYELKVEIRADLENGLRKIEEEADKKTRWIKRDLTEEIEKIRSGMNSELTRRVSEIEDGVTKRLGESGDTHHRELAEIQKYIELIRKDIQTLDQRTRVLMREQQRAAGTNKTAPDATGDAPLAAANAQSLAESTSMSTAAIEKPTPPPLPATPSLVPTSVATATLSSVALPPL